MDVSPQQQPKRKRSNDGEDPRSVFMLESPHGMPMECSSVGAALSSLRLQHDRNAMWSSQQPGGGGSGAHHAAPAQQQHHHPYYHHHQSHASPAAAAPQPAAAAPQPARGAADSKRQRPLLQGAVSVKTLAGTGRARVLSLTFVSSTILGHRLKSLVAEATHAAGGPRDVRLLCTRHKRIIEVRERENAGDVSKKSCLEGGHVWMRRRRMRSPFTITPLTPPRALFPPPRLPRWCVSWRCCGGRSRTTTRSRAAARWSWCSSLERCTLGCAHERITRSSWFFPLFSFLASTLRFPRRHIAGACVCAASYVQPAASRRAPPSHLAVRPTSHSAVPLGSSALPRARSAPRAGPMHTPCAA